MMNEPSETESEMGGMDHKNMEGMGEEIQKVMTVPLKNPLA
ncbi:hypothetical protein [Mesobacillus sp.]